MKRFLSVLLIAAMSFSMVACGSSEKEAANETIKLSVQAEADWLEYYQETADRVTEKYPEVEISLIETGSFDHLDVLDSTDVMNKDIADVFAIPADRIHILANKEALSALDAKQMAENIGGFGDYDAGLGGNFRVNGEYLAFPMNIETLVNFANTSNAATNNVNLNSTVEFTELDAEDMLIPVFNAWFGVALTNTADIAMLDKTESGELYSDLTKDFSELTAEQQEVFGALYDYWSAHNELGTTLWDKEAAWGYMDSEFATDGNNVVRLEGPWSTGSLSNLASDGEALEILPITHVTLNGSPLAHWKGGWGMVVNSRVEENEAQMEMAQIFIEELLNPEQAVELFSATGKIMENVDKSVYENSDLSDMDKVIIGAVIESYENAPARPLFTEWGAVWDTWETSLLSWSAVKPATVEDAYEQVQASFKAMMMNF